MFPFDDVIMLQTFLDPYRPRIGQAQGLKPLLTDAELFTTYTVVYMGSVISMGLC